MCLDPIDIALISDLLGNLYVYNEIQRGIIFSAYNLFKTYWRVLLDDNSQDRDKSIYKKGKEISQEQLREIIVNLIKMVLPDFEDSREWLENRS